MHLKNQKPVFVPAQHRAELEKLSKAALMDMVWDYAARSAGTENDAQAIMREFRATRDIILTHRVQAKAA